ncbi:hypothetical protein AAGW05_08870 [Arthrobacter sp. LAPM80]|uniref:hypothetical protein n=1 Tax=Arthrobacter sp. LAPM80 TaxID=3141788 RepID=UPI00398A8644
MPAWIHAPQPITPGRSPNTPLSGERNESECPGPINSGLFSAFLERADVLGYFVGHDHVNTYCGNYYGVQLGYAPGTGFGAYGLAGLREGLRDRPDGKPPAHCSPDAP